MPLDEESQAAQNAAEEVPGLEISRHRHAKRRVSKAQTALDLLLPTRKIELGDSPAGTG